MADTSTFKNTRRRRSKSSNFVCKFFIVILFLLIIPFIPSQAPEFITQSSIFSKLWELLHLMFIGLAVCYGLFTRKSTDVELEIQPRNDTISQANFNGVLGIPSFFEDGVENLYGYDEKGLILQSSQLGNKRKSLLYENGYRNSSNVGEDKVAKSWKSEYFRGESMVVVANTKSVVDELGKSVSKIEDKPLNLPVRSLRSRVKDANKPEGNDGILDSNSSFEDSSENDSKVGVGKVRGMAPVNLERRFEKVARPDPIRWRSRSGRMEMSEDVSKPKLPSHARPHSVGEFDFEILKSRMIRPPKSSLTNSSSYSAIDKLMPSDMKTEKPERNKDIKGSSIPGGETAFVDSQASHFSIGSSNETSILRNEKENLMGPVKNVVEQSQSSENRRWDFFDSDIKLPHRHKVLSRGKSVRTFRSGKQVQDEVKIEENNLKPEGDNAGKLPDEIPAESLSKEANLETPEKPLFESISSLQKLSFSETQSEDSQDFPDSSSDTSEENSASQSDSFKVGSDEEAGSGIEGSEVDRKAGEFIAKFKEQIRLQKLASIKRYRK